MQDTLPLTLGSPVHGTYTEVSAIRAKLWSERGFELLEDFRLSLVTLESVSDQEGCIGALCRMNNGIIEIGALDPRWLDYSVLVFSTIIDYNHSKKAAIAKRLTKKFQETLVTLYGDLVNP